MPFPLSRQTVSHVGVLTTCLHCHKPRSIYEKKRLSATQIIFSDDVKDFMYACETYARRSAQ